MKKLVLRQGLTYHQMVELLSGHESVEMAAFGRPLPGESAEAQYRTVTREFALRELRRCLDDDELRFDEPFFTGPEVSADGATIHLGPLY